ncbi:MAG: two-component regulator propeller domain-containing protein [Terracidiphilus sp.]
MDPSGRVTQYSTQSHLKLSTDYPRGIVEGTHGDIWVATEFGVNLIRRGSVELLSASDGLPSRAVRTLFLDRQGCMWIGTDAGPAVSCNGALVQNRATSVLNGEEIWAIAQDESGTMWFGTQNNGIYAVGDSDVRHLTTANGLPSNDICGLIVDRTGNLWVSALDSVFSISSPPAAAKRGEKEFIIPRSYVLPSDAEGLRFTRGRISSATLDARGAVWFATDRGAVFIDPPAHSSDGSADEPTPVIRSVAADNSMLSAAAKIRTGPNPRRLIISFGSDYLGPAQETLLMYRLKGVDEGWVISSNAQQAEYGNLSAGSYWFELKACDRTQPDGWKTTSCLIVVPVVWYRSLWFFVAVLAAILGTAFLAYSMRIRRIHYGFRLILEERNRLAREMHDTLIQGCNGVAMLLEAEASRREETGDSSLLSVARAQIRATVSDARDALWNLRQSHSDSNYLYDMLKSIAAHATKFFDIPVEVHFPKKLPTLPSSSAHELMMIVREAVTNAGTHGSPRRIVVFAKADSERISIEISDDGIGFDVGGASVPVSDHYGIQGMQERAAAIGASFEIASKPGAGTRVRVSLPCR